MIPDKLADWIDELLAEHRENLFRYKGVISVAGKDQRYVFQGVHELFEGEFSTDWKPDETRMSRFVFIGRHLDHDAIAAEFDKCKAPKLRFKLGDIVEVLDNQEWRVGVVDGLWQQGHPYLVVLDEVDEEEDFDDRVWVYADTEEFVRAFRVKRQKTDDE